MTWHTKSLTDKGMPLNRVGVGEKVFTGVAEDYGHGYGDGFGYGPPSFDCVTQSTVLMRGKENDKERRKWKP